MNDTEIVEKLSPFGLSRQEASVYLFLLQNGVMGGYEVAKQTGISRSNVYSTLASLTEKGAAHIIDGNPTKYVAVNSEEYCSNYIRHLTENAAFLAKHILKTEENSAGYITIHGYRNITDKMNHMFTDAKERIYLSLSKRNLLLIMKQIKECSDRGIRIVIISDGHTKPDFIDEYYESENKTDQIRMIVDSKYVLTGDLTGDSSDSCLYCAQENFVNVFKDALRNEIKLIKLCRGEK